MSEVRARFGETLSRLPAEVKLVAVSKFHPAEVLLEAYEAGARIFGESRVQELVAKRDLLPADVEWHFIGHLQPNKVKYIAPFISLIHAVDSEKLLREIDKQGRRFNRVIPCLLQIHVAREETKFGFTTEECHALLKDGCWRELNNVELAGLMCMASNTDDCGRVRQDFRKAYDFYKYVKHEYFVGTPSFHLRSWGMSGDYELALQEGSNMVRIGSFIFGEREY